MVPIIVLVSIILLLLIALGVCIYFINLNKHYYDYTQEKTEKLEKDLENANAKNVEMLDRLNKVAYMNTVSNN